MKHLWCCPDYSGWILAGWHGSLFRIISWKKAGAAKTSLGLWSSDFTSGNFSSSWQKRETMQWNSESEQNDSGHVSDPKEPQKQNKEEAKKKKTKHYTIQTLLMGQVILGFPLGPLSREHPGKCMNIQNSFVLFFEVKLNYRNPVCSLWKCHQANGPWQSPAAFSRGAAW